MPTITGMSKDVFDHYLSDVRNQYIFLTLISGADLKAMKTLPETILERSALLPEGGLLTPKEFLHLGSRAAVDQAFSRLAKVGLLIRAARGLYVAPVTSRGVTRAPATEKVIGSLASKTQEVIAASGARSAHLLGLSAQLSARDVFLTSGRSRMLKLGDTQVEIRHAPRWMLSLGTTTAGVVVRALAWIGEGRVSQSMEKLRELLLRSDWQALSSIRFLLPSWMALAISREAC